MSRTFPSPPASGAAHMEVMEQAQFILGQTHGTELETAFEETVHAASALILAFHLDLASAATVLARRVRQAALAGPAAITDLASIAGTAADLAHRAHLAPGKAGAAHLDPAASRLASLHAEHSSAHGTDEALLAAA